MSAWSAYHTDSLQTFEPGPPFDAFIENVWCWRRENPDHANDTIMASGRLGLMVNLNFDELS